MGTDNIHLEVAIARDNLQLAMSMVEQHGLAVFGTMDGKVLKKIKPFSMDIPVYFYEPG